MEKLFQNMSASERTAALSQTAFTTTTEMVERELSPTQVDAYKSRQAELAERETEIEDWMNEHVKPLREEIKDIKTERKSISRTTKRGYIESEEVLYWIQDHDAKQMVAYDSEGNEIKRRRMKPEERQGMMLNLKTA
jgi:hypothetical protein